MRPLNSNDIESELSYAYLHAVAAHVGAGCQVASRSYDGNGIDAMITGWGPFRNGGYLQEISIHVQLKATVKPSVIRSGHISYPLNNTKRYDDLRSLTLAVPRIMVVMYLPEAQAEWLNVSDEKLLMKKCAYWVSLRGAGASSNTSGKTVYIPQIQIFNEENLETIFSTLSRREHLNYSEPEL